MTRSRRDSLVARLTVESLEERPLLGVVGPSPDATEAGIQPDRTPTLIVPGIFGSLLPDIRFNGSETTQIQQIGRVNRAIKSFLVRQTPFDPQELVPEQLGKVYDEILERFERAGYTRCESPINECGANTDLFFAAYDWRLPVLVDRNDPTQLLWDDDPQFESGVEYLDFWIELARSKWSIRHDGNDEGFAVNIVAHSMGGLVARGYIEEAAEAGMPPAPVNRLIMLGTPNHGSVAAWQYFNPSIRLAGTAVSGCSTVSAIVGVVLGPEATDPCLRSIVADAMKKRDRLLHLPRGTSRAVDVVQSLQDLLPTFPFLRRLDSQVTELPETNHLLARLNPSTADLTAATDVLLIGTDTRETAVFAEIIRERSVFTRFRSVTSLRFQTRPLGDGRVLFDRIPDLTDPVGLVLPATDIAAEAMRGVQHGNLPKNDGVICRVFDELQIEPAGSCER